MNLHLLEDIIEKKERDKKDKEFIEAIKRSKINDIRSTEYKVSTSQTTSATGVGMYRYRELLKQGTYTCSTGPR